MKRILLTFLALSIMGLFRSSSTTVQAQNNFYDFTVTTITGETLDLSEFKGKKVLVVNTASKCGFTPQYEGLEELYKTYKDKGFVVLGFPANNFLRQEPGDNEDIASFCKLNYGVTFPMMAKISVKGSNIHPLYKWLTKKSENGVLNSSVSWNFQKFLIDESGNLVASHSPKTKPTDKKITAWIEGN